MGAHVSFWDMRKKCLYDILAQGTLTQNGLIEGGTVVIAVAGHTDVQVLHAAAATEFMQHVRALCSDGQEYEARRLWASVVEVVHLPPPEDQVVEVAGFPPLQKVACSTRGCRRWLQVSLDRALVSPVGVGGPKPFTGASMAALPRAAREDGYHSAGGLLDRDAGQGLYAPGVGRHGG